MKTNLFPALRAIILFAVSMISPLVSADEQTETQLGGSSKFLDLTAEKTFNLKEFIDANYPGKPVVVDFWNTWCAPCLRAHKETSELKALPQANGIVFLYVCDDTSDPVAFSQLSPLIGGEQVLLLEETAANFLDSEELYAIPSYFFFDRNHTLIHKQTAFPGKDNYLTLLRQLK